MEKFKFQMFVIILVNVIFCVSCNGFGEIINIGDYINIDTLCNFDLIFNGTSVSESCREQLTESCNNETVLATMIDASSKFPYTGLAKSTNRDYGGFDQCIEVDYQYVGGRILGKHCLFGLTLIDEFKIPIANGFFALSVCMPDSCTAVDYNIIFQNITMNVTSPDMKPFPGVFNEQYCVTKETGKDFSVLDYVTILLFSTCLVLMIICTVYDLYLNNTGKKPAFTLSLAFSVYSNGKKLFQTSKRGGRDQILIFHGLKIVSMLWIIAGHGASIWELHSMTNKLEHENVTKTMGVFYLSSAVLGVDTFFFLSGFLAGWGYMKKKRLSLVNHIVTTPLNYIHRYLRLTPALITILLVQLSLFGHFGSGPLWHSLYEEIQGKCKRHWWSVLLYIQNYYNYDDVCMLQSWYLSADMQMFLISPIVLIPLAIVLRRPERLKISMFAMFILNIILTAVPIKIYLSFRDYDNGFSTHTRLNTYFLGIMMGVFLHETRDQPFLGGLKQEKVKLVNIVMWVLSLLTLLGVNLMQRASEIDGGYEIHAYHEELKRPLWAAGLAWIIYSSYYGYGGFINWLLTRPLMQIGGKLSYCIYLVHGLVVIYNVMVTRTRQHFSYYEWFYIWCGNFILATAIAFLWTLAFESPLITVEKFIFGGGSSKKKQKKDEAPPPNKPDQPTQNGEVSEEKGKNFEIAIISKPEIL